MRDPEYAVLESTLKQRIAERPNTPVALFVGSSRVTHGFDAGRAAGEENVVLFNFGVPGSGPFFQEIMLDRLRQAGVKPDVLFLELLHPFFNAAGPFSLDHGLLDGARLSAGEARGLLDYGSRSRTGPLRRWAYARLLPAYRHQAEMRDRLGLGVYPEGCNPCSPCRKIDAYGYRPREEPRETWPELSELAHRNYDPFFGTFQLDSHPWLRLVKTIAKARKDGTQVVVILMPEGSEFRALYTRARPPVADAPPPARMRVRVVDAGRLVIRPSTISIICCQRGLPRLRIGFMSGRGAALRAPRGLTSIGSLLKLINSTFATILHANSELQLSALQQPDGRGYEPSWALCVAALQTSVHFAPSEPPVQSPWPRPPQPSAPSPTFNIPQQTEHHESIFGEARQGVFGSDR